MNETEIEKKLVSFFKKIKEKNESVLIAYSGGVDSALLAYTAIQTDGLKCAAVTFKTALMQDEELAEAQKTAKKIGIQHILLNWNIFDGTKEINRSIRQNMKNRCYVCKKNMYEQLKLYAQKNNYKYIIDGTNADDERKKDVFRPGRKVLDEMKETVISPYRRLNITKEEIRTVAKNKNLCVADKPSESCLATRLPYGEEITQKNLGIISNAETILKKMNFFQVRVRLHSVSTGNDSKKWLVRIETEPKNFSKLIKKKNMEQIKKELAMKEIVHITLDMNGYSSGSMDYDE